MSSYQRNNTMVACILSVLIVGAIAVGALTYYGTTSWNWSQATTDFAFEAEVGATTGTVTLDINVGAGAVAVTFVDNATLLYDIDVEVLNRTVEAEGAPTVSFAGNVITFDYTAAGVNITLGSGVNYTMNIAVTSGGLDLHFIGGAHIGDVNATVTAGGMGLLFTDDVVLLGSPTFDLYAGSGAMTLNVGLPAGVGGSVECASVHGGVYITAPGWTAITSNHYETSDYDTAPQSLSVIAQTSSGAITATLT